MSENIRDDANEKLHIVTLWYVGGYVIRRFKPLLNELVCGDSQDDHQHCEPMQLTERVMHKAKTRPLNVV